MFRSCVLVLWLKLDGLFVLALFNFEELRRENPGNKFILSRHVSDTYLWHHGLTTFNLGLFEQFIGGLILLLALKYRKCLP